MTTNDNKELSHATESAIESDVTNEIELNEESFDFEELEHKLESDLIDQLAELDVLEDNAEQIGNPESLGDVVANVVWEQVINQIGKKAGEDFIRENRGLTLDLRDSAHIQTPENFEKGKIATHNYKSREQLEKNYDRYKNKSHGEFRKEFVNPGMNATLERAGELNKKGVETVTDIYTGRQIPTETKLDDGTNNPMAAQREHVKPSAEVYQNVSLQMANSDEKLAAIINDPENLQGYTTAERNNRKSDSSSDEMEGRDKNKHWEKANKRAEEHIKKKEEEGEKRLKEEGQKTQKEEALRISGAALKSILMGMLADLVKTIIRKLINWFQSAKKNFKTFLEQVKCAIEDFFKDIRNKLLTASNTLLTTLATAILGPVVNTIKKAWIFLKQGYRSLKEAIDYIKNPANKNKSFSILMFEVGKIVVTGLTAGGALLLGEFIEKGLMTIPVFAFEIPLFGSLASILGIFFGALVSGIIGAIALNFIDKAIAKKKKQENMAQQIAKRNDILTTQNQLIEIKESNVSKTATNTFDNIRERHDKAAKSMYDSITTILGNTRLINEQVNEVDDTSLTDSSETENSDKLDHVFKDLKEI